VSLKHPTTEAKAKKKRTTQKIKILKDGHEKAEAKMKQLEGEYNGVIGEPPEWLPNPLQEEFYATRNFLLREYKPEIILQHMERRRNLLDFQSVGSTSSYPINRESNLDSLLYIQKIIKLDKAEGINAYLGESGQEVVRGIVHDERQTTSSKKPRTDVLGNIIIRILQRNPNASSSDVLKELGNSKYEVDRTKDIKKTKKGKRANIGRKKIIEGIHENVIEWINYDNDAKETSFDALKTRITRARKTLRLR
jgi:hypothetical protein